MPTNKHSNKLLELGSSLYDVLNHLLSQGFNLKFIFSEQEILETPYVVLVKQLSIRLVFNGSNQLLQFIELNKFDSLKFFYKENKIGSLTLKNIYNNSFGPTYPGEVITGHDGGNKYYMLSYPGISFKFPIPLKQDDINEKTILMSLLEHDSINASSIVIHHEQKYSDVYTKQINFKEDAYTLMNRSSSINKTMPSKKEHVDIERLDCNMPQGRIMIRFKANNMNHDHKAFEMCLNKTLQQDILAMIGPPDEVFIKNDSRLNIHGGGSVGRSTTPSAQAEIFHNYFRYGFDLLYDVSNNKGARAKKLIIHNNLPNSLFFQKYKKCIWRMIGYDFKDVQDWKWCEDPQGLSTSEMYFEEIKKDFKVVGGGNGINSAPIILNRNDLFNNTGLDNSIEFVTIDETDDQNVVSKDEDNNKAWGQSLIYAYKRCIWEVLSVNGAVNSVTLY